MKEYSYFKHDSNARNDDKLLRVRMKHGAAGYGVFFMLLERLREEEGYRAEKDYDAIAFDLHCDTELVRSVIEDFGLFAQDEETFWSENFARSMENRDEIRKMRSANTKKMWEKRHEEARLAEETENTNAMQMHQETDANAMQMNHEKMQKISKDNININITPSVEGVRVQGEGDFFPSLETETQTQQATQRPSPEQQAPAMTSRQSTCERVKAIRSRLERAGATHDDATQFLRLVNLGTINSTRQWLEGIEAGDIQIGDAISVLRQFENEDETMSKTTCYSVVEAVEALAKVVPDTAAQEAIIDSFRNGTRGEKAKRSGDVKRYIDEINKKRGTQAEIRWPAKYIAKMIGITL